MKHKLYLDLYSFKFRERNSKKDDLDKGLSNNEFLSKAYSSVEENKFSQGFAQNIISFLDQKVYKNRDGTRGAILENKMIREADRVFDILINGGTTGLKQYIIDEEGKKEEIDKKDIVGLKFYARFWLPSGSDTGFIFLQKYGGISIKPIFDSIIVDIIEPLNLVKSAARLKATTTQKRMQEFLDSSDIKEVTLIGNNRINETGGLRASSAELRFSGTNSIRTLSPRKIREKAKKEAKKFGFILEGTEYKVKVKYVQKINENTKQQRTVYLGEESDENKIIPNIWIPKDLINTDNSPKFKELGDFVDQEIEQLKKEAKK